MCKIVTWEGIHRVSTALQRRWVMISVYRKRHEDIVHFFKMERGLVACNDIDGLMQTLSINHNPLDWRLLIDSSKLVSKQFSFTMATPYLLFLLVIQCIIRSHMRTWRFWWTPLITINQMENLWWPKSDCLTAWTTTRIYKILLLHLWMGQQSSVSSLLKKGLACQKISGSRNHECGKSTTSGTE